MSLRTDLRDEIRQLEANGWTVTKTGGSHWRCIHPDVPSPIFTSGTPSDWRSILNFRAEVKRALRSATIEDKPMQTATVAITPTTNATIPPWQPHIRVYRTPEHVCKVQAELVLGAREAAHLGGAGAKVRFEPSEKGGWRITPDENGAHSLVQGSRDHYRLRSTAFAADVLPTGRTEIPSRLDGAGFVVFPAEVKPVAQRHSDGVAPRKRVVNEIPSEIKRDMHAAVDIMAPPSSSRQPSLDDLRTALEMLRTIVTDLGADLYLDDAGIVRARIVI